MTSNAQQTRDDTALQTTAGWAPVGLLHDDARSPTETGGGHLGRYLEGLTQTDDGHQRLR